MRIIIVGAGEVGRFMATTLGTEGNNVVLIDTDEELLKNISEHLDVMTVHGNGARINTLKKAGIQHTDLLIAVTSKTESNIITCQVAKFFNVKKTICRVSSHDYFSEDDYYLPEKYGIDKVIYPIDECAKKILKSIQNPEIKEFVPLVNDKAAVVSFMIRNDSPLYGKAVCEFPEPELLKKIRVCAISRNGRLIIPRGQTKFGNFDEVYFAGENAAIEELLKFAFPETQSVKNIIISGVTPLSLTLTKLLNKEGYHVRVIDIDETQVEVATEHLSAENLVLHGDANDPRMLEEAGIEECDIFISSVRNESNLFSSLLAKRCGAKKVYAVADQQDTLEIMGEIKAIDTTFSVRVDAVNELLNSIRSDDVKVGALLKRIPAELKEFELDKKMKIVDKKISDVECPENTVFALVVRNGEIVPAVGDLQLIAGDRIITIADKRDRLKLTRLITRKKIF